MDLRTRAEQAVRDACEAIDATLTEEETGKVANVIERAIIDAVREASQRSSVAAAGCCDADKDMAHKIAEEIERTNVALIANLSSMR